MDDQLPRAILFDLDGTILDWQTGMEQHWREACENGCNELDGIDVEPSISQLLAGFRDRRSGLDVRKNASVCVRDATNKLTHDSSLPYLSDMQESQEGLAVLFVTPLRYAFN